MRDRIFVTASCKATGVQISLENVNPLTRSDVAIQQIALSLGVGKVTYGFGCGVHSSSSSSSSSSSNSAMMSSRDLPSDKYLRNKFAVLRIFLISDSPFSRHHCA